MKKLLLLCALLGACESDSNKVMRYLGPTAFCLEGSRDIFLCTQQVGDQTFTVLCIYDRGGVLCANFPSYDPPQPAAGGTCNAR